MLTVQQIANGVKVASQEYPLRKVELFGSYANGKNTAQSDVDLLVEFMQPRVSLLTISALKFRMEELLGDRRRYCPWTAPGGQHARSRQEDSAAWSIEIRSF